jgi:hypothetical protein
VVRGNTEEKGRCAGEGVGLVDGLGARGGGEGRESHEKIGRRLLKGEEDDREFDV